VPVRWRLALWNSLVLAVVLAVIVGLLWTVLTRSLQMQLDSSLESKAADVTAATALQPAFPRLIVLTPDVANFTSADTFLQIVETNGRLVDRSPNLGQETLPWDVRSLEQAAQGNATFTYREVAGQRLRIYTAPLRLRDQTVAVVQVARPTTSLDETKRLLAVALLASGGGGLLLSLVLGWWLAGLALAPVRRVTQTAREIALSGEPDSRLEYQGPNDELGSLSATFNTMLDRLSAVLEAQRRFVGDASHELRTPMTTLRLNIHSLLRDPSDDPVERRAVLSEMAEETDRLTRLVNGLLELARADAGRQSGRDLLSLDGVVQESVHSLETLSSGRVQLDRVDAAEVYGSRDGLRQVVLILLDNALKFSPPRSPVVVSLGVDAATAQAQLTVKDFGKGIAAEDMPHLFDRFYRSAAARQTSGTGLGLAIARTIVEEHGGTIEASSDPAGGATFCVTLPLASEPTPRKRSARLPRGKPRVADVAVPAVTSDAPALQGGTRA
jgi:two-component system, OmpR family, sensor kinase